MTNLTKQNDLHSDSKNWKCVFFYYNPKDSRLIVEKRVKWMGFTFNYAHKMAWIWTVLIFLFISLLICFLPKH